MRSSVVSITLPKCFHVNQKTIAKLRKKIQSSFCINYFYCQFNTFGGVQMMLIIKKLQPN
jgi:hypothetical protein